MAFAWQTDPSGGALPEKNQQPVGTGRSIAGRRHPASLWGGAAVGTGSAAAAAKPSAVARSGSSN